MLVEEGENDALSAPQVEGKMPQNKKLIINADDFGICQETNKAIKELFLAKKITSTSLLAVGDGAEDA